MQLSQWRYCPHCGQRLLWQPHSGRPRPRCRPCGRVYFADPKVTVAVLIERGPQLLLGQRGVDPQRGLWTLPGGFVDYGEPIRDAAAREVQEETGLRAQIGPLLGAWDFDDEIGDKKGVALFFRALAVEGEPVAGDDLVAVGWFSREALPPLAFPLHARLLTEVTTS